MENQFEDELKRLIRKELDEIYGRRDSSDKERAMEYKIEQFVKILFSLVKQAETQDINQKATSIL